MEFPLIEFYEGEEFSFYRNSKMLSTTNKLSLKNSFFSNSTIIDCSGNCYKIIDAKKVKNLYPFWKFEFFDPMIQIQLEIEKSHSQVSLDDLKTILKTILKNKGWLAESDGQLEERPAVIERSETFRDIIIDMMNLEYYEE
jgi:hypothetical protein